jgi:hypothetical protein
MQLNRIARMLAAATVIVGGTTILGMSTRPSVEFIMGTWSTGSFDNDDASDFLARLQSEGAEAVRNAFDEVVGRSLQYYIQVDSAAAAIAAAEIVAAALDGQVSQLPETAKEWLDENRGSVATPLMQALARRAIERVLMKSELKELWAEGGVTPHSAAWESGVQELLKRLQAPVAQTPEPKLPQKPRAPKAAFEPGAVLRIELGDQSHTYARMLAKGSWIAFYDGRVTVAEDPVEITKRPVLFALYVSDLAYERGRWLKVGNVPLEVAPIPIPKQFIQSPPYLTCEIIDESWNTRSASPEECIGLEHAAVWEAEHVEERLRDHYAGRPNPHAENAKVRLKAGN